MFLVHGWILGTVTISIALLLASKMAVHSWFGSAKLDFELVELFGHSHGWNDCLDGYRETNELTFNGT